MGERLRLREARAISHLKFQISNEMQRQEQRGVVSQRHGGTEAKSEAKTKTEALLKQALASLRTSRTLYGICCDLRCGFYGAGGGACGAWVAWLRDCAS